MLRRYGIKVSPPRALQMVHNACTAPFHRRHFVLVTLLGPAGAQWAGTQLMTTDGSMIMSGVSIAP